LLIPTRWFAEAELAELSLRVTHDPGWQIEVLDSQQQPLVPTDLGGPMPDQSDLSLGRFRVDPREPSLDVRLTPHQPAGRAVAWTQVSQLAEGAWSWRHLERLLDEGQITARLFWPTAWATKGSLKLSPSLKELARRQLPDGIELTVQSLPDASEPREVLFEAQPALTLAVPPAPRATLRVASPTSLDVANRTQHWLVADTLRAWLPPAIAEETRTFGDASTLPEGWPSAPNTADIHWLTFPAATTLELTQPAPETELPSPKLLWMDTTVWVADGAITQGRTWLLLQPQGLRELLLDRPEDIRWVAAFVGDQPHDGITNQPDDPQALRLDRLPNEPLVWIAVFWQIEAAQRDRIVARRDARLPMPTDSALHPPRHDLTLISSGHSDLSSTRGARRVQDWDARLARAEQIFQAIPSQPSALNESLRRLWELAETDLAEAKQAIEKLQPVTQVGNPPSETAQSRLQAVTAEAAAIRSRLAPSLPATAPRPAADLWTSDAWRDVPNAWNALAEFDQSARLAVIVLDRRWLTWMIALLAAAVVIPVFRAWLRWQTAEWLARHPYLAWAVLGLTWWTCLAPSIIGLGLLVVASLTAIRHRWVTPALPTLTTSGPSSFGH
jgi:hypothetical protein